MRRFVKSLPALALLAVCSPSYAQVQDPILSLPDGQVILNISAEERKEVEQDLLVGNLSYIVTNREAAKVQDEINTMMAKALAEAKLVTEVKTSTGAYQVYETTDERSKEQQWRGQQSLTIKSKDSDKVLELAGKLQKLGLTVDGLNYMLAPETAVEVQDNLMEAALKQLQARADRAAKALGKTSAELRDVSVNSAGLPYQPMMRSNMVMMEMGAAAKDMAAPVAAAGDTTISLSVNARAVLKP